MKLRVLERLQGSAHALFKTPLVELTGRNHVLIENHSGVLKYSLDEIQVKVSYGKLVIKGQKLHLLQMNSEQLVIKGMIDALQSVGGNQ